MRPALTLAVALWIIGCAADPEAADAGEGPPADAGALTLCGRGQGQLELGVGNPFEPRPDHTFEVGVGRQGGFHLDLSVRIRGSFDPDTVDVLLQLGDGAGSVVAEHNNDASILPYGEDDRGPHCDYRRARMVFVDAAGGLLRRDAVPALTGRDLPLTVSLKDRTRGFEVQATERAVLRLPADW